MNKNYLVITELFLPTKGGTAVWFDEVYPRIGGKEIHIITADVPGAKEHDFTHKNTVHRVGMKRYWWLRPESLAMYLKLLFKGISICSKNKFDAIHAGRVLPEGLVGLIIAKLFRKPLVIYAHGEEITTWRQSGKFKAMVFTYKRANKVIANSDFTKNELLKLGVLEKNIASISPGVDIDRFKPGLSVDDLYQSINMSKQQKLILSVGRLSRRKGFDNVVRSLPELLQKGIDVRYAIIGIGEDREYLEKIAVDLNVRERVHFLGHVSSEDLPRWYNACAVFAMPNREINGDNEGFGMVFLETAACGRPVIAGVAGGTGSAVEDGVTGLRVDGESLGDIVSQLCFVLTDFESADKFGHQGYLRAQEKFSWDKIAKKTLEL